MRVRISAWPRVVGGAAMVAALSIAAVAQPPTDHTVHHQDEPKSAPPAAAPKPVPAPGPGTANTGAAGMEHMMAVEKRQLFPSLIAMPPASDTERQRMAAEAHARMSRGLPLIVGAGDEAMRHFSTRDYEGLRAAASRAREGIDLLDSGLSTHLALAAGRDGPAIALDWFKSQMALSPPQGNSDGRTGNISPGHLTAMLLLTLLAGGLLALQVARHRRLRAILAVERPSRSAAPPPAARLIVAPPPELPNRQPPANDVVPSREMPAPKAWSGQLRVAQIIRETPSIKTFRLIDPSGTVLPFDYLPGQFMQVEIAAEGGPLRRAYTLASSPTRKAYAELTIKREAKGQVSQHLHDHVAVGDALKVSAPYGHFTFTGMDDDAIVLIGGGVGVTPLMSVVRYLTDLAWPGQIYFIYAARSTEEFAFRAELEYLQQRHRNLQVLATMLRSEGTTWMGPQGQITRELLLAAVPELSRRRVHLCGPPPMMTTVKALLLELGVAADRIHTESFGPPSRPADVLPPAPPAAATAARIATTLPAGPPAAAPARTPQIAAASVVFARSGKSAPLPDGMTVLEAAEAVGVDIPWSCRIGISGTCRVRLLEGEVSMDVQDGLTPSDKAAGYILACQAKTKGGNLVVEA